MNLKEIFDTAKEQREKTFGAFFATRVLPVVRMLVDKINEDPDLGVSVKLDGENGGLLVPLGESQHFWAFEFQFHNKSDGSPAGTAPLRLCEGDPESAIHNGRLGRGNRMFLNEPRDRDQLIEGMIKMAAQSAADRASFDAAAPTLRAPAPQPWRGHSWPGGRTII